MVRRRWTGLSSPRDLGGVNSRLLFLSPWHGETPRVVSSQCLCLRYFHASLVTWVILRSSFQAEVLANWQRRLWHLRRSEREGEKHMEEEKRNGLLKNHKISKENGSSVSLLRLRGSTIACWFENQLIKEPYGWPQMCWIACYLRKSGFAAITPTSKLAKAEFRLYLGYRFVIQAPQCWSQ